MTTVILAAGTSSRMNGSNKLLLEWGSGETLLGHTIRTALSFTDNVYIVTGYESDRVHEIIRSFPVKEIHNKDYEIGQESSIRAAAEAIDDSIYFIPCDLPLLTKSHLVRAMINLAGHEAARPFHGGIPGHPVAVTRETVLKFRRTPGKRMREILDSSVHNYYEDDEAVVLDVDTQEAYENLKKLSIS